MKNLALTVQYKGTNYSGFQIQPKDNSVQEELEKALTKTCKENIKLVAAGRTDQGVHALGQVINFHTKSTIDIGNFPKVVNYHLPSDISVVGARYVDEKFSARFSAKSKVYRYVVYNHRYRSAIHGEFSFNYPHPVDIERMREAVKPLIGTHDFTSFMGRKSIVKDAIRTIYSIDIERNGDFIEIIFHGKSFLKNMIRIIVGSLLEIGRGRRNINFLEMAMLREKRGTAGFTAPSSGLFLMEVRY